jgi:hypothetical protein
LTFEYNLPEQVTDEIIVYLDTQVKKHDFDGPNFGETYNEGVSDGMNFLMYHVRWILTDGKDGSPLEHIAEMYP